MFIFAPSPVAKTFSFPRTAFGEDTDGDGAINVVRGIVEASGTNLVWQPPGAFPTTASTVVPQAALPALRDAFQDILDDAAEADGGTTKGSSIAGTTVEILTVPGGWTFGAYTITSLDQLEAHRDACNAILAL